MNTKHYNKTTLSISIAAILLSLTLYSTPSQAKECVAKGTAPVINKFINSGDATVGFDEKIIYHVNDSANASAALKNAKNHLNANPKAKIAFVTHGKGIDFLLNGAADSNGNPYDITVQELKGKNVDFRVCNNTLKSRNLDASAVIPEAQIVPSGVAEVSKLQ